jgi:hypothetical protein
MICRRVLSKVNIIQHKKLIKKHKNNVFDLNLK